MASVSLGDHFDSFVREQIARGRYQNVSEVIRAALRLLEDYELGRAERLSALQSGLKAAWDDPRPSRPADEVFDEIERIHEATASRERA
ncbi:MAG: type II toxin-antitoxin system ParD family antitoxin [Reyranellaceae bacterium]